MLLVNSQRLTALGQSFELFEDVQELLPGIVDVLAAELVHDLFPSNLEVNVLVVGLRVEALNGVLNSFLFGSEVHVVVLTESELGTSVVMQVLGLLMSYPAAHRHPGRYLMRMLADR